MRIIMMSLVLSVLTASSVQAGRRIIGVEKKDKAVDALPDGDQKPVDAKAAAEDEKKKRQDKKAAAEKKAEAERLAREQEIKKQEAAELAARNKAAEAKRKKLEAAAKKKADAELKKKTDAAKRLRSEQNAARRERGLQRSFNDLKLHYSVLPGAPEAKAVQEVKIDLTRALKVQDPRYGHSKPVLGAKLIARIHFVEALAEKEDEVIAKNKRHKKSRRHKKTVKAPADQLYRVHALADAGVYGLHFTLPMPGHYSLSLNGQDAKGKNIESSIDLYAGQWPPPDWAEERARSKSKVSGRRRPLGM